MQIKFFWLSFFCTLPLVAQHIVTPVFTVMLNPFGDAKHIGRKLDDSFERGITLQCTEKIKEFIETQIPQIRIVLTRFPGETIAPLQNANFANRLDVDVYLSIHFYHEERTKPNVYIYTFSYGDTFITKTFDLNFYDYDKAHLINQRTTQSLAQIVQKTLTKNIYQRQFLVKGVYTLPFAPLIGIKAPAIALEIGLKQKDDWKTIINPITACIAAIISNHYQPKQYAP